MGHRRRKRGQAHNLFSQKEKTLCAKHIHLFLYSKLHLGLHLRLSSLQIVNAFSAMPQPHGVAVYFEAHHLCTQMRGIRETSPLTRTMVWRVEYEHNSSLRVEFLLACGPDL